MNDSPKENKPVDLDTILVQDVGQFGLYQLRCLFLAIMVGIFISSATNQYIFTTARMNTRCLIPECDSNQAVEFSPSWILNAVPGYEGSFDNCNRFTSKNSTVNNTDVCPATNFNQDTVVACEQYVYENTDTIVYEYDLGCDEWRRSLVGSIRTVGMLLSHPITGYISDRWGRRVALTLNAFNTAWLGLIRYWAPNYISFTVSQFLEGALGFGCWSSVYILMLELVGPKYRDRAAAATSSSYALGMVLLGIVAWTLPNWKQLTLALYIPQFLAIFYMWIMPESARWYMSKGRYEESEIMLRNVARVNGKELSEKSLLELRQADEERKKDPPRDKDWLIVQVFRHKFVLIRCIVAPIWWISGMCTYYGMSINAINMSGDKYVNYIAVSAAEIPGYWLFSFLLGVGGRKPVMIGGFWLCAVCMAAFMVLSDDYKNLSLIVYLIGKCSISGVMMTVYVYTAELFPTKYRHSLFAYCSMMSRFGVMFAPLTPALASTIWESFPYALFGGLALISGASAFLTPETRGKKLSDTMEEADGIKE